MGLAFVAEKTVAGVDILEGFDAVLYFKDGSLAAEDEDSLAAIFVGVDSDRGSRDEESLEETVPAVEVHVGTELLVASFEGGDCA